MSIFRKGRVAVAHDLASREGIGSAVPAAVVDYSSTPTSDLILMLQAAVVAPTRPAEGVAWVDLLDRITVVLAARCVRGDPLAVAFVNEQRVADLVSPSAA